ncbi:MAG: hypothetical protein M1374_04025 [Firmicutes bacterium]|nr:hypothetical protein [Bacillota bacterium]
MTKASKFSIMIMIGAIVFASYGSAVYAAQVGGYGIKIPPTTEKQPVLPLYSSQYKNSTALIEYAENAFTKSCMASKGFPYPMLSLSQYEQVDSTINGESSIIHDSLGVSTLSEARLSGYSYYWPKYKQGMFYAVKIEFGPIDMQTRYERKYGPTYLAALHRPSSKGGCQIPSTISHLVLEYDNLTNSLSGSYNGSPVSSLAAQTTHNPLVIASMKKWSACMASKGYDLKTPPSVSVSRAPTKSQIAMAVTDYNCKEKANLINTWLAVYAYYQNQIINKNPNQFQKMQQLLSQIPRAAQKAISSVKV